MTNRNPEHRPGFSLKTVAAAEEQGDHQFEMRRQMTRRDQAARRGKRLASTALAVGVGVLGASSDRVQEGAGNVVDRTSELAGNLVPESWDPVREELGQQALGETGEMEEGVEVCPNAQKNLNSPDNR